MPWNSAFTQIDLPSSVMPDAAYAEFGPSQIQHLLSLAFAEMDHSDFDSE